MNNQEHLNNLRHSAAHLLAAAVMNLWPDTKRTIGPAIDDGFYFDFEFKEPISQENFPQIEQEMRRLVKKWNGFEKHELSAADAKKEYPDNPYKHELIEEFSKNGEKLSFYKSGEYWDLCKGGHIENPREEIKHFKLLSVAGAYWRGDEKNQMLTRIYGTIFETKEELDTFLKMKEEAKLRDHRKLGADLDLFFIDETVGKGLIMWLPKGTIVKNEIEKLVVEKEQEYGYVRVSTPHIAKEDLFKRSGHLPYYKDSIYPGMQMDDAVYYLKAMNCPHHHTIYNHKPHSYRELPLRLAEYGTCYRNELSGTLAGLLRVRGMSMNDAHIYARKDQIKDEFKAVIKLTQEYFEIFGLTNYWFRLSKWDPNHTEKYIDEPENWKFAEETLREVLEEMKVEFKEVEDEAAFYGPKVDVQFKSVIGREETMSTIQLDFAAKKRFDLRYIDEKGEENNEVFVIHRAPLSVHERFLAFLLEHYAGNFPLWLSPIQVRIIPIAERHNEKAIEFMNELKKAGIRAEVDEKSESMQKKIREAQKEKVYYMAILGDREIEQNEINLRDRSGQNKNVDSKEFIKNIKEAIETRKSNA